MLRNTTPQLKALARQKGSFRSFNFRNEGKQLTSIQPQKIQICSRGKTEFRNPNNPMQDKIKRVQNFKKFGKKGCSYNNWRPPGEHRSLDNFFFEQQTILTMNTNMLNSSKCLDFPNGRCMYFNY